jgi:ferredoxin
MARPMWLVKLIKQNFKNRFAIAGWTKKAPLFRSFVDWLMFEDDIFVYLPKDRIIINQAVSSSNNVVLPSEVVKHFIHEGSNLFIMDKCICRDSSACKDYPIDIGCLFIGTPTLKISPKLGHQVSKNEAYEHLDRAREAGLVHSLGRNKLDTIWLGATPGHKLLTVCHCCPCCCLYRVLPDLDRSISSKITHMPGVSVTVNRDRCEGCGACAKACLARAITIETGVEPAQGKKSVINDLCVGCGRCVEACPHKALELHINNDQFIEDTIRQISEKVDVT